jgi:hypothetical protein
MTLIGTWASFSALTTALGPVLGGWLVDTPCRARRPEMTR